MKFGTLPINQSKGGILAHSLRLENGKRIRKGALIDEVVIGQLMKSGIETVTVAMSEEGDVLEDEAATLIAKQLGSSNLAIEDASTGRVNIFAASNGVFCANSSIVNAINAVDPSITIATLSNYAPVNKGRLVATIKIIPYAVSSKSVEAVLDLDLEQAIIIKDFKPKRIGMISTKLPSLKSSIMDKTRENLERRLALSESSIVEEIRVEHDAVNVSEVISKLSPKCDVLIIFGASAISDIADCIPQAIEDSGGEILRFGMPVDPGNLMLLAKIDNMPIIGAPGCARSIAENGFDWVLQRLLADITISSDDIAKMGVGGLLMETGSRPHPREKQKKSSFKTAAVILAAGQSRRMGDLNKMTVEVAGKPMVRHVGEAAVTSAIAEILVVTGHKPNDVKDALNGLAITLFNNPHYENGLSTSLSCGIKALSNDISSALILLGDMPYITSSMIDELAEVALQNPNHIIVSTHDGKRGNPVLWPRSFFDELCNIQGDTGARHIMAANQDRVIEVELGKAASLDLDTPQAVLMEQEKS